jgi:hypothetical protein
VDNLDRRAAMSEHARRSHLQAVPARTGHSEPALFDRDGRPVDVEQLGPFFAAVQAWADELQDRIADFERGLIDRDELIAAALSRPARP